MTRIAALSPEQRTEIRRWMKEEGYSVRTAVRRAQELGWQVSKTVVGEIRKEVESPEQGGDLAARVTALEERCAAVEAALATPAAPEEPIDRAAALQRALNAVTARMESPKTDPRAVADLARTIERLGKAIADLELGEEEFDGETY